MSEHLQTEIRKLENIITELQLKGNPLTPQAVRKRYENATHNGLGTRVVEYGLEKIKIEYDRQRIAKRTFQDYCYCINNLANYERDIAFEAIDQEYLENYRYYLQHVKDRTTNGIYHDFATLKRVFNMAIREGITRNYPFKYFRFSSEETIKEYLTPTELQKLDGLYFSYTLSERLQKTLGFFLFTCYTGISYDDLIHKERIKITDFNLVFTRKKIKRKGKLTTIPITHRTRRGLDHGKQNNLKRKHHRVSTDLAETMEIAGIHKHITYHCGRHTFAVCSLMKGISLSVIQDILGHSSIKTTEVYLKIVNQYKEAEMKKWDD